MKTILNRFMTVIEKIETYFMVAGLVFITLLVFTQVVLRLFGSSLNWGEELSRFIFIFITWIGASLGVRDNEHIKITILNDLAPKTKKYTEGFATAVCLAVCIFLVASGIDMVEVVSRKMQYSPALKIPIGTMYTIIPAAGFLMGIKYVRQLFHDVKSMIEKEG